MMDEDAIEEIVKRVNPENGLRTEINSILNQNESLQKSETWNGVTDDQYKAIRSRVTATGSDKGVKFEKNGKTYIRVGEDNYRRVTKDKDVYKDKHGNVWLRDEKGRFSEVID